MLSSLKNEYIKEHWLEKTDEELANVIGCPVASVRRMRSELGLYRTVLGSAKANASASANSNKVNNNYKLGKLQELLDKSNIDIDEVETIKGARINSYQGFYKNKAGEAQTVDLESSKLNFVPKKPEKTSLSEPAWPVVHPAQPVVVVVDKVQKENKSSQKTAIIFSDSHFGFRLDENGKYPFHDKDLHDTLLQVVKDLNPDYIVNAGDFLDLPAQSRYVQEPKFQQASQAAIDAGYEFLAKLSAVAHPNCEKIYLEGNHDIRLSNYLLQNACAAFGIKQANRPASWPVLSIPHLLRLDELGWEFISGWPNNFYYLNEETKIVHGSKLKVDQVADEEFVNVIQGHTHRIASTYRTRRNRHGTKQTWAAMIGCMSNIDGSLPSTKASLNVHGQPTLSGAENWQQGFCVVTWDSVDNYESTNSNIEQIVVSSSNEKYRVIKVRGKGYYI